MYWVVFCITIKQGPTTFFQKDNFALQTMLSLNSHTTRGYYHMQFDAGCHLTGNDFSHKCQWKILL